MAISKQPEECAEQGQPAPDLSLRNLMYFYPAQARLPTRSSEPARV